MLEHAKSGPPLGQATVATGCAETSTQEVPIHKGRESA